MGCEVRPYRPHRTTPYIQSGRFPLGVEAKNHCSALDRRFLGDRPFPASDLPDAALKASEYAMLAETAQRMASKAEIESARAEYLNVALQCLHLALDIQRLSGK